MNSINSFISSVLLFHKQGHVFKSTVHSVSRFNRFPEQLYRCFRIFLHKLTKHVKVSVSDLRTNQINFRLSFMILPEHVWLWHKDCHREAAYGQRCTLQTSNLVFLLLFSDSSSFLLCVKISKWRNKLLLSLSFSHLKAVTPFWQSLSLSLGVCVRKVDILWKKKEPGRSPVLVHYCQLDLKYRGLVVF